MRAVLPALLLFLSACGGVVWDTTVADSSDVRRAMVDSVRVGQTTETQFVTRWGPPLQKVREGARTEFVYRRQMEHARFVIVTFEHGTAIAVRSSDTEPCRGTFPQRAPGYGFDRPDPVAPVGWCGPPVRPEVPVDGYDPFGGAGVRLPK